MDKEFVVVDVGVELYVFEVDVFSKLTSGIGVTNESFLLIFGLIKICPFGSSTSQSKYCILFSNDKARFVAIVVLPVPPFPLAILMIIKIDNNFFSIVVLVN